MKWKTKIPKHYNSSWHFRSLSFIRTEPWWPAIKSCKLFYRWIPLTVLQSKCALLSMSIGIFDCISCDRTTHQVISIVPCFLGLFCFFLHIYLLHKFTLIIICTCCKILIEIFINNLFRYESSIHNEKCVSDKTVGPSYKCGYGIETRVRFFLSKSKFRAMLNQNVVATKHIPHRESKLHAHVSTEFRLSSWHFITDDIWPHVPSVCVRTWKQNFVNFKFKEKFIGVVQYSRNYFQYVLNLN